MHSDSQKVSPYRKGEREIELMAIQNWMREEKEWWLVSVRRWKLLLKRESKSWRGLKGWLLVNLSLYTFEIVDKYWAFSKECAKLENDLL